ncbi:unnamed protein product [Rangifer tarandus platyrhynchus]|uniref:Uncharacterized protein n=1 Tax=Rangifer tarandus platyrhynchus TaxID=3082113 RepID=A0ACB1MJU7_RANTA
MNLTTDSLLFNFPTGFYFRITQLEQQTPVWLAVISRYHVTWRLRLERSMGSAASGGKVPPRPKPETPRSRVGEARTQRPTASVRCLRVRGGCPAGWAQDCNPESKTNPWMAFSRCILGALVTHQETSEALLPTTVQTPSHGIYSILPHGSTLLCSINTAGSRESPGASPHSGTIAISRVSLLLLSGNARGPQGNFLFPCFCFM